MVHARAMRSFRFSLSSLVDLMTFAFSCSIFARFFFGSSVVVWTLCGAPDLSQVCRFPFPMIHLSSVVVPAAGCLLSDAHVVSTASMGASDSL